MSSLKKPPVVALERPKLVDGPAVPRVVPVTGRLVVWVVVPVTTPFGPVVVVTVVEGWLVVAVPLAEEVTPASKLVSGELPTLNA